MAKADITEVHSKTMTGTLNTDNMTMEFLELGIMSLSEVLSKFNGQNVTLKVNLKSEPEE